MWGFIRNLSFKSPAAICLACACALPTFSQAATFRVDQARPGETTGDGGTWQTAFKTIAEAMTVATSSDEIWVAKGIYSERITLKAGVQLYGGFNATETLLSARD
jgi:hypothetical protein